MVATRGQAGGDGPVTSTPNAAAPVPHTATLTPVSEAGSAGRCGDRATSADAAASTVSGTQTTQMGISTYTDGTYITVRTPMAGHR